MNFKFLNAVFGLNSRKIPRRFLLESYVREFKRFKFYTDQYVKACAPFNNT